MTNAQRTGASVLLVLASLLVVVQATGVRHSGTDRFYTQCSHQDSACDSPSQLTSLVAIRIPSCRLDAHSQVSVQHAAAAPQACNSRARRLSHTIADRPRQLERFSFVCNLDASADPGSSVRYPSSELSHIEPIQGFTLHHIDNAHLHEAHAAGKLEPHHFHTQSNNAARSLAAHSQRTREVAGLTQPFPDQVTLTFHAFGREFHLPQMQLMVELFVPESKTVVENHEEGTRVEMPNVAQSYEFRSAQLDATATIHEDGLFHALIREYDAEGRVIEMYQAEPVENHRRHHEAQAFEALSSATPHGVVVFKHSDLDIPAGSQSCGSIAKDESLDGRVQGEMTVEPVQSAPNRRLLASIPIGQGVTRWTK
jgi:hypothetical protein